MSSHCIPKNSKLKYLDLNNIIKSPENDNISKCRYSKRISRSICSTYFGKENKIENQKPSSCSVNFEKENIIENPKPPKRRRKSILKRKDSILPESNKENVSQVFDPDLHTETLFASMSLTNICVNSIKKSEVNSLNLAETIPVWLMDVYYPKQYLAPKNQGLSTILEEKRRNKNQVLHDTCKLLRRQVFIGQTLEEACIPNAPGIAPLDTDSLLSMVRKRLISRQKRAKKLGFKGINISKETEAHFEKFIYDMDLNSSEDTTS